jgi:outer membrane protein TolC
MDMETGARNMAVVLLVTLLASCPAPPSVAQNLHHFVFPEQRRIEVRDPAELAPASIPNMAPPVTVADLPEDLESLDLLENPDSFEQLDDLESYEISLDEAIRIALANSEVVRVLTGVSAASSGRTIYDTAIVNTGNDDQRALFDPVLEIDNIWNRAESPFFRSEIFEIYGERADRYDFGLGLSKRTTTGGTLQMGVNADSQRQHPTRLFLDPQLTSSLDFSFTQPLLQGGGRAANLAPLVLAQIDTERSYFQFKDSVQELVRGVIEAYWSLVFARTDRWARQRQVQQAAFALELAEARFKVRMSDVRDRSQARVSLQNFKSSLYAAQDSVLQREAALRNIMGLPPTDGRHLVPTTPPTTENYLPIWDELLGLAEQRRPDLIELKLVLEADQQRMLQVRNQAYPSLDALAIYRWNGLEGELATGDRLASGAGQFTDWTLGVTFSVPLGLRRERARLREQELIIARDRANLQQGLHAVIHTLAQDFRSLQLLYSRYELARDTIEPAAENLRAQRGRYRVGGVAAGTLGQTPYINLLLAITDWGNAISSEAQFLTQFNTLLAKLERDTGTILETHGIYFYEERFTAIGPAGRLGQPRCYPAALTPSENAPRYPNSDRPSEEAFELTDPSDGMAIGQRAAEQLPPPRLEN